MVLSCGLYHAGIGSYRSMYSFLILHALGHCIAYFRLAGNFGSPYNYCFHFALFVWLHVTEI